MIHLRINNEVIPDVVEVIVSGISPHDGHGNPGRGRTTHLLVKVTRSADRTLVQQAVAAITNGDGSAVAVEAHLEFLDPEGLVQHSLDIGMATMSRWRLELRADGAAFETATMTVRECTYHAGGENAAFEAA